MPSEKFHTARAEGAFVAMQMMKEACGRFSQPARALPISSTQVGNLLVIQSFASTSLWNPEISSKAPSSQVARTAQVSAEDVSECRIWRTGSFVMIALAVNQPPSGPFSPMQLVNARQNIKFGLGAPRRNRRFLGDRARLALACETSSREQATRHIRQKKRPHLSTLGREFEIAAGAAIRAVMKIADGAPKSEAENRNRHGHGHAHLIVAGPSEPFFHCHSPQGRGSPNKKKPVTFSGCARSCCNVVA